ncbi:conserved hypothetical protein [Vibrio parahaemolyticus Peru-466]|nr:conserved hypothetical protein [Vibrio parahaemolyticus Peru-466]EQM04439.1 hypothetical protein D036_1561 [Vibrio parahaemolyticus VP232]ETJ93100.1 hypothetical protein D041_1245 [Vibrio parahaemolyticus EKP-008]EVU13212.1 hypothetical protein D046_6057 [Vibrio parahaemolyticus V-223/04]
MGDETEFKIRFEVLVVFGAGNARERLNSIASSRTSSMVNYDFLAVASFVSFQYWMRTRCS